MCRAVGASNLTGVWLRQSQKPWWPQGESVLFTIDPILLELEGGHYMGPILPGTLTYLIAGRKTGIGGVVGFGGVVVGSGGGGVKESGSGGLGGGAMAQI